MDLTVLIEPKLNLSRLAEVLNGLGHEGRVHCARGWSKHTQATLYEAIQGFHPLTLDHFVPPSIGPLVEVIHHGKNTLPAFSHFQKRFCKPSAGGRENVLWGYNHNSDTLLTTVGPGFFVTKVSDVEGEIAIDYKELPPEKPESWPVIVENESRLGNLVYAGMVDHMRGLSDHVSIGRAEKGGKMMDAWFVLVREDVS